MKIKLKKKNSSNSGAQIFPKLKKFRTFYTKYIQAESYTAKYRVLADYYNDLFSQRIPLQPLELVLNKISYELLRQDYADEGVIPPKKVLHNIRASANFSINELTENMRQYTRINIQHQKGEEIMVKKGKTKKAAVSKKAAKDTVKKVGVAHLYLEIFDQQAKNQLTDEQIADAIEKKSGTRPTGKNVASYRCMYNAGNIAGQTKVPTKVKAFRGKASKVSAKPSTKKKLVLKKKTAKKKK